MIFEHNGVPLFYKLTGQGPPLVLLHGFLESNDIWQEIAEELKEKYTLLMPDLPGHGRSGIVEIGMAAMVSAVGNLIKHLGWEQYSCVGHSMGGYVGLALLEQFPTQIKSIVLLNSHTFEDGLSQIENRNRALRLVTENAPSFLKMAIPALFPFEARDTYRDEIKQLLNRAMQMQAAGINNAIISMRDRENKTTVLAKHQGKKVIITGERDHLISPEMTLKMVEETKAELFTLSGGHMSWLENKDEIVKILRFIE